MLLLCLFPCRGVTHIFFLQPVQGRGCETEAGRQHDGATFV